jgi:hypothetical protein
LIHLEIMPEAVPHRDEPTHDIIQEEAVQDPINLENNNNVADVPNTDDRNETTSIRRSSRLPHYSERYLAYRKSLGRQAVCFAMPASTEDTNAVPV